MTFYAYNGKLGVDFVDGTTTLGVGAPTAISVGVWLYDNAIAHNRAVLPNGAR
jgi:hypothetical protein